jgi:hypothetical protein
MRRLWLIPVLFLAVACGGAPGTSATGPDQVVSTTASPGASGATPSAVAPSPVTPVGDALQPHEIAWTRATPSAAGTSLDIVWWSGVAPCTVLDRVEVREGAGEVTVTLNEGHDRRAPNVDCNEIAVYNTTTVKLPAPLGDRRIADGAK